MVKLSLFAAATAACLAAMPAQAIRFETDSMPAPPIILVDGGANGPVANASVVPEPSSWLTMLVGFGLMGMATRRRARVSLYGN
jgi:hypothetical protein